MKLQLAHSVSLTVKLQLAHSVSLTVKLQLAHSVSLTVKLHLAHSGSSVVTCPFPAYSDPWDIFVATCPLRRCSLSGEILVPTSERLREGETEEGSRDGGEKEGGEQGCISDTGVTGFSGPLVLGLIVSMNSRIQ